jgi:hypothetical protein
VLNGLIGKTDHPSDLYDFTGRFNLRSQYFYKNKSEWPNAPFNFDILNATKDKEIPTSGTTGSFYFTYSEGNPQEVYVSPSGDYLFLVGAAADRIQRLDMTTPFDIETGSTSDSQSIRLADLSTVAGTAFGSEGNIRGIFFRRDGLKFYVIGTSLDTLACFNLSIAWDLSSTITYDSKASTASFSGPTGTATTLSAGQVFFKPDGSRFYIVEIQADCIVEYSIPSGEEWSLTNASQVGNATSLGAISSNLDNPSSIYIDPTGVKVFIHATITDRLYELVMTTPWDLSTLAYTDRDVDTDLTTNPAGITFSEDNRFMYVVGSGADKILRYS